MILRWGNGARSHCPKPHQVGCLGSAGDRGIKARFEQLAERLIGPQASSLRCHAPLQPRQQANTLRRSARTGQGATITRVLRSATVTRLGPRLEVDQIAAAKLAVDGKATLFSIQKRVYHSMVYRLAESWPRS